ncbi:MAG: translation elongation factor Ts [bacterium]
MSNITASIVSELRSITGAGMMDCKNALEEAQGDIEKAGEILRKKGIIKASKRAGKIASEGLVNVSVQGNTAVVVEINSETDFVAKNDDFKKVIEDLSSHVLQNKPTSVEQALGQNMVGVDTVQDYLTEATAKIGEKITLRRLQVFEKGEIDAFGAYIHMGGKIGVLVVLEGSQDQELAKDIAMHTAAANPRYLNSDQIPAEVIDKEKEVYTEQLRQQGKPENIIENILKGKLNKFYEEVCLVDQMFIKDDKKKVSELLPEGSSIKTFARYELGEGLEKKSCDFVAEVQEQMGE